MSQIAFALKLGLVPNVGYETIGANYTGLARALDIGRHLILPALTLGAVLHRALCQDRCGASMLEVAGADFVEDRPCQGAFAGGRLAPACRPATRSSPW